MFRDDTCTIKRPVKTIVEGETIWSEPAAVYTNVPCHLSVKTISPTEQTQSTASVLYDFKLFTDTALNISIEPNDIIEVKTSQGQNYNLRAAENHKYRLTTQTHCEDTKIV